MISAADRLRKVAEQLRQIDGSHSERGELPRDRVKQEVKDRAKALADMSSLIVSRLVSKGTPTDRDVFEEVKMHGGRPSYKGSIGSGWFINGYNGTGGQPNRATCLMQNGTIAYVNSRFYGLPQMVCDIMRDDNNQIKPKIIDFSVVDLATLTRPSGMMYGAAEWFDKASELHVSGYTPQERVLAMTTTQHAPPASPVEREYGLPAGSLFDGETERRFAATRAYEFMLADFATKQGVSA